MVGPLCRFFLDMIFPKTSEISGVVLLCMPALHGDLQVIHCDFSAVSNILIGVRVNKLTPIVIYLLTGKAVNLLSCMPNSFIMLLLN